MYCLTTQCDKLGIYFGSNENSFSRAIFSRNWMGCHRWFWDIILLNGNEYTSYEGILAGINLQITRHISGLEVPCILVVMSWDGLASLMAIFNLPQHRNKQKYGMTDRQWSLFLQPLFHFGIRKQDGIWPTIRCCIEIVSLNVFYTFRGKFSSISGIWGNVGLRVTWFVGGDVELCKIHILWY